MLYAAYLDRNRREAKLRQIDRDFETERKRRWRAAHPEKARTVRAANHAVEKAVKDGRMIRPDTCSRCGACRLSSQRTRPVFSTNAEVTRSRQKDLLQLEAERKRT